MRPQRPPARLYYLSSHPPPPTRFFPFSQAVVKVRNDGAASDFFRGRTPPASLRTLAAPLPPFNMRRAPLAALFFSLSVPIAPCALTHLHPSFPPFPPLPSHPPPPSSLPERGHGAFAPLSFRSAPRRSPLAMPHQFLLCPPALQSEDMQQDAIDTASQAMEKFNIEKDIAAYIKKEFDKKHGPTWHTVVGRNFGSYVTHETKNFIYFYVRSGGLLFFSASVFFFFFFCLRPQHPAFIYFIFPPPAAGPSSGAAFQVRLSACTCFFAHGCCAGARQRSRRRAQLMRDLAVKKAAGMSSFFKTVFLNIFYIPFVPFYAVVHSVRGIPFASIARRQGAGEIGLASVPARCIFLRKER